MAAIQVLSLLCLLAVGVYSVAYDGECTVGGTGTAACDANMFCEKLYSTPAPCAITGKCKCKKGFAKTDTNTCETAKYIGDTCTDNAECSATVADTICSPGTDKKCTCATNTHKAISKYNCVLTAYKRIGENCVAGTDKCYYELDAKVVESDCPAATGVCACSNAKKFGTTCKPAKIDEACTATSECPLKSTCDGTTDKCACATDYVATPDKTMCVIETGQIAEEESCVAAEQKCAPTLTCAVCNPATQTKTFCAQATGLLGATCATSSDSECSLKVAVCNTETKCACGAGYEAYGSSACLPSGKYDSVCGINDDCTVANTACDNNLCKCAANYVVDDAGTGCIKDCSTDATVCPDAENRVCESATKRCKCKDTHVKVGDQCVTGLLGSVCGKAEDCNKVTNAVCTEEKKCACAAKFKKADDKCVAESGAGIKSSWLSLIMVSGLLSVLSMKFF